MSFTGSQRQDERRRRRLASEDSACGEISCLDTASDSSYRLDQPVTTTSDQASLPLQLWLSRSLWKHLALVFTAWSIGIALLVGSHFVEALSQKVGPGVLKLLGPAPAPLVRGYSGLLLLLASQLAAVVWWVRASSAADFSGRYWIWLRAALLGFGCSVAVSTGCAPAWSESVKWAIQQPFWKDDLLLWLWPVLLVGGVLFWGLCNEMRQSRGSWMTLSFAAICYLAAAVWCLDLLPATDPLWGLASVDGLALTGHVATLLSFSLHARHVIHFSAEPAPRRKKSGIPRPHFGWLFRRRAVAEPVDAEGEKKPRATRKRKEGEPEKLEAKAATPEVKPTRRRTVETVEEQPAVVKEAVVVKAVEQPAAAARAEERVEVSSRARTPAKDLAPDVRPAAEPAQIAPKPVAPPPAPEAASRGNAALGRGIAAPANVAQTPVVFNRPASTPAGTPAAVTPAPATSAVDSDSDSESEPDEADANDSPEMRGLSRKQRRKLEQQMRREGR